MTAVGSVEIWGFQLGLLPGTLPVGFLPVIPLLVLQIALMLVLTLSTSPPRDDRIDAYRNLFEELW